MSLRVCRVCRRQKKRSFRSLIFSYFGILCSVSLSSTFFSVCDGFGEMTSASLSHYLSFLFFFSTSSHCSPIYFLFLLSACSSQSLMSLLNYPASAPSICPSVLPSFLPSFLTSMRRLSLWQTCAITRTLRIIARLSIKGVISPQCPMS